MKKVLLIGDSIRLGYQDRLTELLKGKAEVVGPKDNCRYASHTLWHFSDWIIETGGNPDIIYWNNGKWDICDRYGLEGVFCPLEDYIKLELRNLQQMRATGAKVFFSTIIPYHSDYPNKNMIERVDEYNNAIVPVLEKEGVVIDDLNKVVTDNITNNLICSDLIHLNENGIEVCANHIAEFLESYL